MSVTVGIVTVTVLALFLVLWVIGFVMIWNGEKP